MTDRRQLARTFESAAQIYQDARPEYPSELYDELVHLAALQPGDQLLEMGCATGKATLPLARRGFPITCVELGQALAAEARRNVGSFPAVQVFDADFETWQPHQQTNFALVFAATAWRWVDPVVRYRKAWTLLRPGGCLAFWNAEHLFPPDGDTFFQEIQAVYEEIGEGLPQGAGWPAPGDLPDDQAEIESSNLFGNVVVRHFDWETAYTADEYIRLLDTFSSHITMADRQRHHLYGEIRRRLARRPNGRVRRHWGAVLHVAQRLDDAPDA